MRYRHPLICAVLILACFFSPPIFGSALKKATFIPLWIPQAQFAGYYVAKEKGIYRKHGIDLTIIPGGPNRPASDYLKDGKADFACMWVSAAISMWDDGIEVVHIAQMLKRSALMLVAKKKSDIRTVWDMDGKKVSLWGANFQYHPKALFRKYGINVNIVPQSISINLFLRDGVQVASAMWYNEYHTIINAGLNPDELVPFFFHDHSLNFPEDGIYTLNETLVRDPDLCRSFVEASAEGWRYAFDHPEEAVDIMLTQLKVQHLPANRMHQKWMLNRIKDLTLPDGETEVMGKLDVKDFLRVLSELDQAHHIHNVHDFDAFHRYVLDEN